MLIWKGPEIRYDNSLPEVLDVVGDSSGASTEEAKLAAFRRHWLSRRLVLFICMASVVVAVIIAVNVRLGPATKKICWDQVRVLDGLYLIQLILHSPLSQTPTNKPTGISFLPSGILNDSALAAVELPNGDRRVFFQGNIRQAVYQGSRNQWSASLTDIIVSDAKMHTPLAAIALNKTDEIVVDIFHGVYLV